MRDVTIGISYGVEKIISLLLSLKPIVELYELNLRNSILRLILLISGKNFTVASNYDSIVANVTWNCNWLSIRSQKIVAANILQYAILISEKSAVSSVAYACWSLYGEKSASTYRQIKNISSRFKRTLFIVNGNI